MGESGGTDIKPSYQSKTDKGTLLSKYLKHIFENALNKKAEKLFPPLPRKRPRSKELEFRRTQTFPLEGNIHKEPSYRNLISEIKSSSFIMIRHGNSVGNHYNEMLIQKAQDKEVSLGEWMDVELSPTLIDCGLSRKGIDQCSVAAKFVQ